MAKVRYGLSTCIGETLVGMPYPVFFDPHYAHRINKPPVSLITGSPGSGKTFFGLILAAHASIMNKQGFIFDPKGDFFALKKLERAGYIKNIHIWSVISADGTVSEENVGMLDPTTFTNNTNENTALTIDIITLLTGEVTPKQRNALTPIIRDICESESKASFQMVVSKLLSSRDEEIRSLGYSLDTLLQTDLAKLLVKNKRIKQKRIKLEEGFVVANLMGLKLPSETTDPKDYSSAEKVSICVMGLLTSLILDIMGKKPKTISKTLIIDEAWAIMATKAGRNMIKQVGRLGRSLNMAAILLTQSPTHLEVEGQNDMETMVSSRFAFRNGNTKDNLITCNAMKLPEGEGWETLIPSLETGECLMQDSLGNMSFVHVMAEDGWGELFNTNPADELARLNKNKQT